MKKKEWTEEALQDLFSINQQNVNLTKKIYATVDLIANKPQIGELYAENMRLYSDPEKLFRISYVSVPGGNLIAILGIFLGNG